MKSEKMMVSVGFIVISIIWGSTWLVIKIGLESVPPFFGVAIRFTLALFILAVILAIRRERILIDSHATRLYLALGVLSFSFPFALIYWGEQYITSGLASILFAAYPFIVASLSYIFLPNEKLDIFKIVGITIGFCGVLIIFWSDFNLGEVKSFGMGAVLLSTLLQGISLIIIKRKGKEFNPIMLNFGGIMVSIPILYMLAFLFEKFSNIHFDVKGLGSILYLGSFGTVVTFVSYYWLVKRVEVLYLSLTALVTPVLAVILGGIILEENLSPRVFLGGSLVLCGILITNGKDLLMRIKHSSKNERIHKQS